MFEKLTLYRGYCDYCGLRHNITAPKSALKTHLEMSGWKVSKDELMCPKCKVKIAATVEVDE